MAYRQDIETDFVREYDMINTLFHGAEEEKEARRKEIGYESDGCDCPPAEDGIAVRILKFLFGDRDIDLAERDSYHEQRPYHRHIHTPAHPAHAEDIETNGNSNCRRWSHHSQRYPPVSLVTRNMAMPGPEGPAPGRTLQAETLLRLIATVLCAAAVIIFSTTSVTLTRFKNWLLSV